ncbi:MAG: glycoside hydrolase family 97 protein, partial [Planctomycetota bacterium]
WGEVAEIRNHYNELTVKLREKAAPHREMQLVFRVYDDGIGFRYELPSQPELGEFVIAEETTQFRLPGDPTCWWIPDSYDTYEMLYTESPLSKLGTTKQQGNADTHATEQGDLTGANTPLTMQVDEQLYVCLHEAALSDYAGTTLQPVEGEQGTLQAKLVPWPNGDKVRTRTPMQSPWRTIQIGERPGDLLESHLIANLNEPNKLTETSFIKPMKYIGIWWSMHLGITSWGKEGGKHGATTAEAKRYIDFAAHHDIPAVLIEGWNTGWESWYEDDNFDFITSYDDFDLAGVVAYARERGVEIIGHHETGGQVDSYERRLDEAFAQYQKLGIRAVKTGYAGTIRPDGHYHHGQRMVRHYQKVVETAARYGIMLDVHEPIKPTGLRRTYPNLMTQEGVRGMEWNAWSDGNPPEHHTILPFTRMLAGPTDYTPGIFDLRFERYADQYTLWNSLGGLETKGRMSTTLAKQLALYVVFYSPLQMAADLPSNYQSHPAFQFIRDVPVDWQQTRVVDAAIGDYTVIARQDKQSADWYVGAITDEQSRTLNLVLDFLDPGKTYLATSYSDAADAHFRDNPTPVTIDRRMVRHGEQLELRLAAGGGQAIAIQAVAPSHSLPGE